MSEILGTPLQLATNNERQAYLALLAMWGGVLTDKVSFDPFEVSRQVCAARSIDSWQALDINLSAYYDAVELAELSGYVGKHTTIF